MTRRRRVLIAFLAIAAAAIAAVVVGARVFVPPWLHDTIERVASETLGRRLAIAGTFRLSYSLEPAIVAEDVTLANASWGSEPAMVRIDRITLAVDLPSLASPPIRIANVELDGVRVLLEKDAGGRGNWTFDLKPRPASSPAPGPGQRRPVVVDRAAIRDLELVYAGRPDRPPLRIGVGRLEARLDAATDMVELDATGHFNDAPWDLAGRLGTLDRLYELRDVTHDVSGHVGRTRVALRGRIRDPLRLGDPEVDAEIAGPDIVAALATVGLRSPLSGPFEARGRFSPSNGGVELDLAAGIPGAKATVRGRVGRILGLDAVDASVGGSGPDASVVGSWFGIEGLPRRPFEIAGRLRRDGSRLSVDDVKARVGATSLGASGTIGTRPRGVGTDLAVTAKGTDLSELSALTRLRLPPAGFTARGRFLRRADALAVEEVEIRGVGAVLRAGGTLGEPPGLGKLDLAFDVAGEDLARFSRVATVELPEAPFAVRGRLARDGDAFVLDGVEGRLADDAVRVSGRLVPARRLVGSELEAHVAGPDLATTGALVGVARLAAVPYEVEGRVRFAPDGFRLEGVRAQAGTLAARVEGRIGARPADDGMELEARVAGGALSDLAAWGVEVALPDDPFEVSGGLRVANRVFAVERGRVEVGDDRAAFDGTLGPLPDLSQLDLRIDASGARLADLLRFAPSADGEPALRLPKEAYTFAARVRRVPAGVELQGARGTVGEAEARVDGIVGTGERLRGTILQFEARAPDGTIATELTGVALPEGPIALRGRIERRDTGLLLDGVDVSLGDAHLGVSGTLGEAPERAGTDLEVAAAGTDLAAVLGPVSGLSPLPSSPFEFSAHFAGDSRGVTSERFVVELGENDLEGSLSVRLEGRTSVEADLRSRHLDLTRLLGGAPDGQETVPVEPAPSPTEKTPFFPDVPLGLDALRSFDARVRLTAADIAIPGFHVRDAVLEAELRDGGVRVDRAEGSGELGGRAALRLSLEPVGDGYHLRASAGITGAKLMPSKEAVPPEQAPSVELEFEVEGTGRTLHEIAASSRGGALVTMGPGRVPSNLGALASSGVLRGLLDALNPFRNSSPYTEVECLVVVADVATGMAAVEPVAVRTDRLTVIGRGKVDLDTEAIDFVWTLKPRRGVGISAGSIANPYIKLGGTLSAPSLEAKPLEAAASTGAAVATAGLTVLFKGLYDRITAEKKVCVRALEEAERQAAKREAAKAVESP